MDNLRRQTVDDKRNSRKVREGVVVSDKMDKTIVVQEETMKFHKLYKKRLKMSKNIKHMTKTTSAMWEIK